MRAYPCYLVDAFTTTALGGNPCAVVMSADTIDDATMQAIAQEMNLSETAFVLQTTQADFFSPHRHRLTAFRRRAGTLNQPPGDYPGGSHRAR